MYAPVWVFVVMPSLVDPLQRDSVRPQSYYTSPLLFVDTATIIEAADDKETAPVVRHYTMTVRVEAEAYWRDLETTSLVAAEKPSGAASITRPGGSIPTTQVWDSACLLVLV